MLDKKSTEDKKENPEHDHTPDYLYGVIYLIVRPEGGNSDGS
jgi:hypothetical protein